MQIRKNRNRGCVLMAESTPSTPQVTYQMSTLTPGLSDALLRDDSPQVLQGAIWQFLTIDLSTANLTEVDFLNILDMVDISFANLLLGIPEDQWGEYKITETTWERDPNDPDKVIPVTSQEYPLTELWDAIKAKVYIKATRARDGFMMRILTENRSKVEQSYQEIGVPRIGPMPGQEQAKGKRWGII